MSTSFTSTLSFISQQVVTYLGLATVIGGVIGNTLNIMVFLSLKTFRQSSCAFYLTVMSFVNIGQLLTGQFSRVMITGFNSDWTQTSLFYCKFRLFIFQVFSLISFTCICLATIDQYLATCVRIYWQQWSNIKIAQRLTLISVLFWVIYGIPYLIFYDHTISSTTGKTSCVNTNMNFRQYHTYINNITLCGGLPVLITILFGILAYKNVRQLAYRTVPLVRRELDKQLTNMVLVQVILGFFTILPYVIATVLPLTINSNNDPIVSAQVSFTLFITACFYYCFFSCPFYIYVCVSDRFRQQLIYVGFELFWNRWRKQRVPTNQILPQPK